MIPDLAIVVLAYLVGTALFLSMLREIEEEQRKIRERDDDDR